MNPSGFSSYKSFPGVEREEFVFEYGKGRRGNQEYRPLIMLVKETRITKNKARMRTSYLCITASLPKLLHGTNLLEVRQSDFISVCAKISCLLHRFGFAIDNEAIFNATVKRIDYSKNFMVPAWAGDANQVITLLEKINYKRSSEFRIYYSSDGKDARYIKFYNGDQSYTIYNKLSEIINNHSTAEENIIAKHVASGDIPQNVLRFELSLADKQTVDRSLSVYLGNKRGITFADLYNRKLAKTMLNKTFDLVFEKNIALLINVFKQKRNEAERLVDKHTSNYNDYASLSFILNKTLEIGLKQTYEEIKRKGSRAMLTRIKRKIRLLADRLRLDEQAEPNFVEYLRQEHKKFLPFKAGSITKLLERYGA